MIALACLYVGAMYQTLDLGLEAAKSIDLRAVIVDLPARLPQLITL